MGWKTGFLLVLFLGLVKGNVEIVGEWMPNYGFAVNCSWKTFSNDSLQSVRMYRNGQLYAIFRPEVNGAILTMEIPSRDFHMKIKCKITTPLGQRGECLTTLEIKTSSASNEDTYMCEVSGERPTFRLEKEEHNVFVPPSDAAVRRIEKRREDSTRDVLNCTSSGVPAPSLVWSINSQEVPPDFSGSSWNSTSKLWESWSAFSLQNEDSIAVCTPAITTKNQRVVTGKGGVASGVARLCAEKILAVVLLFITFFR